MAGVIENETTYPMEFEELFVDGEPLPSVVASVVAHVLEEEKPRRRRRRYPQMAIQPSPMYEAYAYVNGDGKVCICPVDEVYDSYSGKWNSDPSTYVSLEHLGLASTEVSQYLRDLQTIEDLEYKRDDLSRDEEIFDKCRRCRAGGICSYCRAEANEQERAYQELVAEMASVRTRIARVLVTVESIMLSHPPVAHPYGSS